MRSPRAKINFREYKPSRRAHCDREKLWLNFYIFIRILKKIWCFNQYFASELKRTISRVLTFVIFKKNRKIWEMLLLYAARCKKCSMLGKLARSSKVASMSIGTTLIDDLRIASSQNTCRVIRSTTSTHISRYLYTRLVSRTRTNEGGQRIR